MACAIRSGQIARVSRRIMPGRTPSSLDSEPYPSVPESDPRAQRPWEPKPQQQPPAAGTEEAGRSFAPRPIGAVPTGSLTRCTRAPDIDMPLPQCRSTTTDYTSCPRASSSVDSVVVRPAREPRNLQSAPFRLGGVGTTEVIHQTSPASRDNLT